MGGFSGEAVDPAGFMDGYQTTEDGQQQQQNDGQQPAESGELMDHQQHQSQEAGEADELTGGEQQQYAGDTQGFNLQVFIPPFAIEHAL